MGDWGTWRSGSTWVYGQCSQYFGLNTVDFLSTSSTSDVCLRVLVGLGLP